MEVGLRIDGVLFVLCFSLSSLVLWVFGGRVFFNLILDLGIVCLKFIGIRGKLEFFGGVFDYYID